MKLHVIMTAAALLLAGLANAEEPLLLKTQKDQVNYAIGVNIIGNFKQQGIDLDLDLVIKGMKDASSGGKLLLTKEELRKYTDIYLTTLRQKQAEKFKRTTAEANRKAGEAFLAENRKKAGVVTLPSGLQYRIIKAGDGRKPTGDDTVECYYRGILVNGTEFDNSHATNRPAVLKVREALGIAGLSEALQLMPMGSTWQIFIPPRLAYGTQGKGNRIGPESTLIVTVELLAIK